MAPRPKSADDASADLGFEAKLWLAAEKLGFGIPVAQYKHIVLGLIFLKYVSDTFDTHHAGRVVGQGASNSANSEDKDQYLAARGFWVPSEARWARLQAHAKLPGIGHEIEEAMAALERDNPALQGALSQIYGRADLDPRCLGGLIELIGSIELAGVGSGSPDLLGRAFEFFLMKFACTEGRSGGDFYTPSCVVRLMVGMLAPVRGRVYDPCCGAGGMLVQSERFVASHGGTLGDLHIYGQESHAATRGLAIMNLTLRGIEADLGPGPANTLQHDLHPDLRADYVLANPPLNQSHGFRRADDDRWQFGLPPKGNANFAWVQHIVYHLAPHGMAGFVMANGSLSSNQSGEGGIRRALIEADLVDCLVALPGQLFYSMQLPVCLWFLAKNKNDGQHRDRRRQTLFIDARKLGTPIDRVHRELTHDDIERIASTYHAWRGDAGEGLYTDVAGFCKSASTTDIAAHDHVLSPGRYVGVEEAEADREPFDEKMSRLVSELHAQFDESARLEKAITANLRALGYEPSQQKLQP